MAKTAEATDSSSKIKKTEKGKKKPSDDDSLAGFEETNEAEIAPIDGPDIQGLSVKPEDMSRIKSEIEENRKKLDSSSNKRTNKIVVRRVTSSSTESKSKKIILARKSDSDYNVEEVQKGMKFQESGEIVDWSICGSKEQYIKSAINAGDIDSTEDIKQIIRGNGHDQNVQLYHEKVRTPSNKSRHMEKFDESNALDNWRQNMALRKKQQGYISTLLEKPIEKLVTSGSEAFREKQEIRDFIDRAIPSIDYGKGFRVGSEFWRQYENIGDNDTGLKMSLKLSEQGEYQDITRIGKSIPIKEEVGENYNFTKNDFYNRSEYLEVRRTELNEFLSEMEEHKPEYDNMIVIGKSVEKLNLENEYEEDESNKSDMLVNSSEHSPRDSPNKALFNGPAIIINGKMRAYGDITDPKVRITFDSIAATQIIQAMTITNCGTTVLFYDWQKIRDQKSFEAQRSDETQRFYFNASPGSILPGNTIKIPFVFKSPNGGYFSEKWIFTPRPALAKFEITLKGNAALPDFNKEKRENIQNRLAKSEANSAANYVLNKILREVKTPERIPSPDCFYRTEEDNFVLSNPGFYYSFDYIQMVRDIWNQHVSQDEEWNLDLKNLRRRLFLLEDFDLIEEQQGILNDICRKMQLAPIPLPSCSTYDDVKEALGNSIDKVSDQIQWLNQLWNIAPTTPFPDLQRPTSSQTSITSLSMKKQDDKNIRKTPSGTRKANSGKGAKKDSKEDKSNAKKKQKSTSKDTKSEIETSKSSTRLSNHSSDGMIDLHDPENAILAGTIKIKLKSITKEIIMESFDNIAAILTKD